MIQIIGCLTERHDLTIVTIAAAICLAASLAAALLPAVGRRAGAGKDWLRPAQAGLSIAAMHYLGMAALQLPGRIGYVPGLAIASVLLAAGLAALALEVLRPAAGLPRRLGGGGLLLLSVVSLHFAGMGAVEVWPDPLAAADETGMPRPLLAAIVVTGTAGVLVAGLAVLAIEARLGAAADLAEAERLRHLADAAFEALAVVDEVGRITDASSRLGALTGLTRAEMLGGEFTGLLREEDRAHAWEMPQVVLASGVPVELHRRAMDTGAGPRTVIALRDLRERLESESRIRHLAHHDTLTGLGNRAQMMQRLEEERSRADRTGAAFALLYLDLDRFKPVNDVHGHAAGDRLLQQVADRLRDAVRPTDLCARLGGDEFVVIQSPAGLPEAAQVLAERLAARLSDPFDLGEAEASISCSIGVALYPTDAGSAGELLRAADVALYRVKDGGRGSFAFFQAEMDRDLRRRRALEREVRMAPGRGELSLAWQPQAETGTGEITGFDALLRWRHPERGDVPPDVFISVAEASGAIIPIGHWVLRTACLEAASWPRPLRVAVNVSALQVQQPDFPAQVARVLAETGLEAVRLDLEITETLLIHDTERALETLRALKALGLRLSLDDFGTGYSSLGTLRAFPFDKLKIDRSFVRQMTEDGPCGGMVRAILGLSRAMALPVVAEGVETEAQRALLGAALCEEMQGYLIGRPQPIEAFDELVGRSEAAARGAA
ncbi:putative bifunctional diguanylate cyclase/phosphodiesterase [Pararoseomonas indoligenes]|uniref:EAL domain-containing protein n=1 Tax=Roseomonas indoligenes TaxID=2820811 RepID=A0A940S3S8_9PROT|nr:EAL domain-containing protein [Pararoseomonas indoligenes]MBP0492566.1 EAL domain-containing protein [Pararoseomonas indoligenes]